jgi:hypothetical protein
MIARRDPALPGLALFAAIAVAGLGAIGLAWLIASRTLFVPHQVPAVVSGGLGGLALVVIGAGLFAVQDRRRLAALDRAEQEALLDETLALTAALQTRPAPPRRHARAARRVRAEA